MVEVFKTNVEKREHATMLIQQIHERFIDYKANFDLDDCDKVLRIQSYSGWINPATVIEVLLSHGFHAEVLPGDEEISSRKEVKMMLRKYCY